MTIHQTFLMWCAAAILTLMGCSSHSFDPQGIKLQLQECAGAENVRLLDQLTGGFEDFLMDNGFATGEEQMLEGYKGFLSYLLESRQGPDTTWHYRLDELEAVLTEMERQHFAEWMYDGRLTQCVLKIEYPGNFLMARYRNIMPQHAVSPEVFARSFIKDVTPEQFSDPVLRHMVTLEYFLGTALNRLRPDRMFLTDEVV